MSLALRNTVEGLFRTGGVCPSTLLRTIRGTLLNSHQLRKATSLRVNSPFFSATLFKNHEKRSPYEDNNHISKGLLHGFPWCWSGLIGPNPRPPARAAAPAPAPPALPSPQSLWLEMGSYPTKRGSAPSPCPKRKVVFQEKGSAHHHFLGGRLGAGGGPRGRVTRYANMSASQCEEHVLNRQKE